MAKKLKICYNRNNNNGKNRTFLDRGYMKKILIQSEYITLGQFLKFSGIISSGAMAKEYLIDNSILVNGELENRRGRKLYEGYSIEVNKEKYLIGK